MFLADRFVKGICHKCNANARGDQCDNCSTIFNEPTKELLHPRCEICGSEPIPTATTHLFLSYDNVKEALKKWLL